MSSSATPPLAAPRPAWRLLPEATSSAGDEVIALAASAGLILDEWQEAAVRDLCRERADGRWAATSAGLIVPRQNGKGSVIEALELAWLFLYEVELIFHSAHLFNTSVDAFDRIKGLIKETPELDAQVDKYVETHGREGILLHTGQELRFVTRSKSGGRGFPAPVVVFDEAFNLSPKALAALVPTMAAQPNPFLLLTSSHPIDDEVSDPLRKFMKTGRAGTNKRRCYIEYGSRRGLPLEQQLAEANPGYGVRLNREVVDEERDLLDPADFEVERLGIVDLDDETAAFEVVDEVEWTSAEAPNHEATKRLTYALDVDVNAKGIEWASIGVSDGLHVEDVTPLDAQPGTGWVVAAFAARKGQVRTVLIDAAGPAGKLIKPLEDAGLKVRRVTAPEMVQASGHFVDRLGQGLVAHIGQPRLTAGAAGAKSKAAGDNAFRFSRSLSSADISPLVAVVLAYWGSQFSEEAPPNIW